MRKCGLQKTIEMNSLHGNSILTSIQCHFCARDFDSSIIKSWLYGQKSNKH